MNVENLSRAAGINDELHELSHAVSLLKSGCEIRVYEIETNYEVIRSYDIRKSLIRAIEERMLSLNKEAEKL